MVRFCRLKLHWLISNCNGDRQWYISLYVRLSNQVRTRLYFTCFLNVHSFVVALLIAASFLNNIFTASISHHHSSSNQTSYLRVSLRLIFNCFQFAPLLCLSIQYLIIHTFQLIIYSAACIIIDKQLIASFVIILAPCLPSFIVNILQP